VRHPSGRGVVEEGWLKSKGHFRDGPGLPTREGVEQALARAWRLFSVRRRLRTFRLPRAGRGVLKSKRSTCMGQYCLWTASRSNSASRCRSYRRHKPISPRRWRRSPSWGRLNTTAGTRPNSSQSPTTIRCQSEGAARPSASARPDGGIRPLRPQHGPYATTYGL
jgi:hypothetical protein